MSEDPITKERLLSALEYGKKHKDKRMPPSWWVERVEKYKVIFLLTDSGEQEVRHLGDYLGQKGLDDLVAAIRRSFAKELDLVGRLGPDTSILLQGVGSRILEIGDSGMMFDLGGDEFFPQLAAYGCRLIIESINGEMKISTQIRDWNGNTVAELIRNEWKVSPATWDRNYTKSALEVKDATGHIVLQVRFLEDRVQLQGEWWTDSGKGLRLVKEPSQNGGGLMIFMASKEERDSQTAIEAIFEYPSRLHFGELRKR